MKTLIIYGTTYGYAEKCAESLAKKMKDGVDVVNIKDNKNIVLSQYDKIIIGGSIYMGQIQKQVKAFCIHHQDELTSKKLGLFICCGFPENIDQHMKNAFTKELMDAAIIKECFGGELNIEKMNFLHRFITKIVSKETSKEGKNTVLTLTENIDKLADAMNSIDQ